MVFNGKGGAGTDSGMLNDTKTFSEEMQHFIFLFI